VRARRVPPLRMQMPPTILPLLHFERAFRLLEHPPEIYTRLSAMRFLFSGLPSVH
jgi:hypothetical protein